MTDRAIEVLQDFSEIAPSREKVYYDLVAASFETSVIQSITFSQENIRKQFTEVEATARFMEQWLYYKGFNDHYGFQYVLNLEDVNLNLNDLSSERKRENLGRLTNFVIASPQVFNSDERFFMTELLRAFSTGWRPISLVQFGRFGLDSDILSWEGRKIFFINSNA